MSRADMIYVTPKEFEHLKACARFVEEHGEALLYGLSCTPSDGYAAQDRSQAKFAAWKALEALRRLTAERGTDG